LPPFHSTLYTWYKPSGIKELVWKYDDLINNEQTIDLKCDELLKINGIYLVSFLDAKQRILLFTDDYLLATNALQVIKKFNSFENFELFIKTIFLIERLEK
jgi:hypothetical protein